MNATSPTTVDDAAIDSLASHFVDIDAMAWEKTRFPGIEVKTLLRESPTGLLTTLVRMAPGAVLPDHEHVRIEQTYVLEGRLVDGEGEATAGNFVWRPAGSRHTAHAPDGALILAFFLAPNRFYDCDTVTRGFD